jgi:hypothetical protein
LRTVQDSWDGLTCLTFACTPRNTLTPKVGQEKLRTTRIVWSHMSHIRCMYHPRNTFTPKVGQDS